MTELLALLAIAFVVYPYLVFPLLVLLRAAVFPRPWQRGQESPSIDVVIVCHNESEHIEAKLRNVLRVDYPESALRLIVASDGSDDGTDEIVRRYDDDRVTLLSFPRRGKIPALNDAVSRARGDVLVFSDANSEFAHDALRNLVRHFADPTVGCVAGNQVYTKDSGQGAAARGEQTYWSYDRLVKQAESRAGNAISATGAIYAIRRRLFEEVPSGVTDDFTISTRVIRHGYRLVFDAEAIAREAVAGQPRAEYRRKVRVMTRGLRAVWMVRDLLNPLRYGFYSLQLFSHKVARRLVFLPLMVLLALVPWLWQAGGWMRGLAAAELIFYAFAIVGWLLSESRLGRARPLAIPYYFCLVNVAAFMAAVNVLTGRTIDRWESHRARQKHEISTAESLVNLP